jgi:ribosomal protein S12 methylthiotransferase accessory factor
MKSSDLLNLDLSGKEVAQLRAAISHRHGSGLAEGISLLETALLIRSPWAPGLRFVGGMLKSGDGSARSVGGGGASLDDAFASCIGEAIERSAQMQIPPHVIQQPWPKLPRSSFEASATKLLTQLGEASDRNTDESIALLYGRTLADDRVLVPVDWCVRRLEPGWQRMSGTAPSVGCAAGPTSEIAAARALLELVERDAAALWWIGGRRARRAAPGIQLQSEQLLEVLRGTSAERVTTLLEITTDIVLPVFAAISTDRHGGLFAAGLGARTTRNGAARAAVLELCQMEIGLQLALLKKEQSGEAALSDDDRRHLLRASRVSVASDPRFEADAPIQDAEEEKNGNDLACVSSAFKRAGIEAALVDLTQFGKLPVIKAIAPDLQQLPSNIFTARLESRAANNFKSNLDIPLV